MRSRSRFRDLVDQINRPIQNTEYEGDQDDRLNSWGITREIRALPGQGLDLRIVRLTAHGFACKATGSFPAQPAVVPESSMSNQESRVA